MKPTEILNSVKELLNLSTETVKEEVKEEVEEVLLAEDGVEEVVVEDKEMPTMNYASVEELMAVKAELLSMIKAMIEDKPMGEAQEVPQELSSEKEVELSEEVEEVVHSPENSIEVKQNSYVQSNQRMTTEQRVQNMLFN